MALVAAVALSMHHSHLLCESSKGFIQLGGNVFQTGVHMAIPATFVATLGAVPGIPVLRERVMANLVIA
ncbi:hypothetical protein BKG70_00565 [Mycobacteroides chelonae]|uniref:hypothetical protein n=1 Tax=Mycobacteroides chelonae TaxID=1774 RepID=UPI0008AA46B8|nr:hypothetical protein [Mycobacteroides chelonae]OHT91260.1 hypothetical protein BKG70_00565 [Mycobacteroides chelonae]